MRKIKLSTRVTAKDVRPGQTPNQLPALVITFYDKDRDEIRRDGVGPWRGSFPWQTQSKEIEVPRQTREAIVHVGLFGAVGEVSFDEVTLERVDEE